MTVEEMMKAFFIYNYINLPLTYKYKLYFNIHQLENNKTLLEYNIKNRIELEILEQRLENMPDEYSIIKNPGKHLHASIKNQIDNLEFKLHAGTLQKIKDFYKYLSLYLKTFNNKGIEENFIISIGKIELKQDDERTFNSFGIRNDFTCIIKSKQQGTLLQYLFNLIGNKEVK